LDWSRERSAKTFGTAKTTPIAFSGRLACAWSKGKMPILNYTTTIAAEKTVAEISRILVRAKASSILTEYDPEGLPASVSFRVLTEFGLMTFRLPAESDRIYKVIVRDNKVPRSLRTRRQAAKVAWRIVKDWIEAQVAMIEAGLVDTAQVFLPYAQDGAGNTVYDKFANAPFRRVFAREQMSAGLFLFLGALVLFLLMAFGRIR
jgi:hypothetical protein